MVKRERTHAEETGKLSALELATGPLLTDRMRYLHRMHVMSLQSTRLQDRVDQL